MLPRKEIIFISSVVMFMFSGMTVIFPVLPFYLEIFGGGATEFGYAASSFALAVFLISPTMGRLADKYGKVKIIWINLIGYSISNFAFVFVTSYNQIILLRFFEGLFTAGVTPAAISIASDLSAKENRARSIAFVTAGISTGVIIGPVLGGLLIENFPIYFPFLLSGILGMIASIFAKTILNEPDTGNNISNEDDKRGIKGIIEYAPRPLSSFLALMLFIFFSQITWLLIEPGFVFYFYNELNFGPLQFGLFVSAFGLFVLIGEIFLGGISDKYGRNIIMFIGSLIYAGFFFYLTIAVSFVNILISGALAGIALGLIGPASNALLSEVARDDKRTFIFGISTSVASVAQIIAPLFGGFLIDNGLSVLDLMLISGFLLFFAASLVYFIKFDNVLTKDHDKVQTRFLEDTPFPKQ